MKALHASIRNFKAIAEIDLQLGSVTIVSGPNESGKTSILDALRSIFQGGHHPEYVRNGAEKAEITLVTDTCTLKRTITAKTSTLKITAPDGSTIPRPESFVKDLCDSFSFDPQKFIDAPKKDRAAFLLDLMPVIFSFGEVSKAVGESNVKASYTLEELDLLKKGKYDARTEANRAFKQTDGTITTLSRSLGDVDGRDWETHLAEKRAELEKVAGALTEALAELEHKSYLEQEDIKAARDHKIAALQQEIQAVRDAAQTKLDAVKENLDADREYNRAEAAPLLDKRKAEIATAEEKVLQKARHEETRQSIRTFMDQRAEQAALADRLSRAIENLEALKASKLAELPVEGLEVRDGDVFRDGIPFDQLNTQRQVFTACEIAAVRMGELPFIILDDFEHVDAKRREMFVEAFKESGWQVIAARVDDQAETLSVVDAA